MSHYQPSVSLHQQDGGLTIQAFAEQHGLSVRAILNYVKTGRVVGARQDSRSKKWTIYPPAKLVDKAGDPMKRREPVAASPDLLVCGSADTVEAGTDSRQSGQPAPQVEAEGKRPSASRGFNPFNDFKRCVEVGALAPTAEQRAEGLPDVYASPEVKNIRRILQEAAARMHREGIHYLRLEGREFSQLYAALAQERSRIRALVGKGLVDVGNLRASDSVWQKMQAMCQEGRLL